MLPYGMAHEEGRSDAVTAPANKSKGRAGTRTDDLTRRVAALELTATALASVLFEMNDAGELSKTNRALLLHVLPPTPTESGGGEG